MREIKFRAWHKSGGVMSTPFDLMGASDAHQRIDLDCCEIMQYTGLKDKNGVEIYEGDVVKAYHHEYQEYQVSAVKAEQCCFSLGRYWKDGIHDWYSMEQYDSFELEVIGNIYENPELLD